MAMYKLLEKKKFTKVGFLSEIENQKFLPEYYRQLGRFDDHLLSVIVVGEEILKSVPKNLTGEGAVNWTVTLSMLTRASLEQAQSILVLNRLGAFQASSVLCRSILESYISIAWVAIDPEVNYPIYCEGIAYRTEISAYLALESVGKRPQELPKKPKGDDALPSIQSMCETLDKFEAVHTRVSSFGKTYNAVYRMLCGKAHGDFAAIHKGLDLGARAIYHGPQVTGEALSIYIGAPTVFLACFLEKILELYKRKEPELERISEVFSKDYNAYTLLRDGKTGT